MAAGSPREQGARALRECRFDAAVDLLNRAVIADDADSEARAMLGIAYSQLGHHAQARRALRTALEHQPGSASLHYNFGVVLERAGDVQDAVFAYRDTLRLDPEHAAARGRLQALAPAPPRFESPVVEPESPGDAALQPVEPPGDAAPPTGFIGAGEPGPPVPPGVPPLVAEPYSVDATVTMPSSNGAAAGEQWETQQPAAAEVHEERFSVARGYRDWGAVLAAPTAFFAGPHGRGLARPMSYLCAAALTSIVVGRAAGLAAAPGIGPTLDGQIGWWLVTAGSLFVWASLVHLLCLAFGGRAPYASTVRGVAFGAAPFFALFVVATATVTLSVTPEDVRALRAARETRAPHAPGAAQRAPGAVPGPQPGGEGAAAPAPERTESPGEADSDEMVWFGRLARVAALPFLLLTAGWAWSQVTTAIGLQRMHSLRGGAVIGVVALSVLLSWAGMCGIGVAAAALVEARRAAGMAG